MQEIGLKNFRRFSDYTSLELGKLNYLVGTNNSGKSTAIKACVLALMNLRRINLFREVPMADISFRNELDAHLHLGDFKYNISYDSCSDQMLIMARLDKTWVKLLFGQHYGCDYSEPSEPSLLVPLINLEFELRDIMPDKSTVKAILRYEFLPDNQVKVFFSFPDNSIYNYEKGRTGRGKDFDNELSLIDIEPTSMDNAGNENSVSFVNCDSDSYDYDNNIEFSWQTEKGRPMVDDWYNRLGDNREVRAFFKYVIHRIYKDLNGCGIPQYIEAHNAPHNEILYEEDKNNFLAQTVTKYLSTEPEKTNSRRPFILKWMKELRIGDNFKITRPFPEVLKVDILSNDIWQPLGKMGTGTIQLFILLLTLSMAEKGMLFVEEPEQNLHPALQSKLADMFYEYLQVSDVQVIVETHSEYLIRRTQVLAASAIKNDGRSLTEINDTMKVYYFPEDDAPYSMEYRDNGQFECLFGEGFYDEAGNNYLDLLKRNY